MSAAGPTEASLNLATAFLDRNVTEGRGDRTALVGPAGSVTYASWPAAAVQGATATPFTVTHPELVLVPVSTM